MSCLEQFSAGWMVRNSRAILFMGPYTAVQELQMDLRNQRHAFAVDFNAAKLSSRLLFQNVERSFYSFFFINKAWVSY